MGMSKDVFRRLGHTLSVKCGLKSTRYVSAEVQIAIFLRAVVGACSNRDLQERFQHAGSTISVFVQIQLHPSIYVADMLTEFSAVF